MADNPFSNLYEKVYGRQGLLGFPEGTFKNAEGFEPLGLSPARQALLAFASGALANSGRYTDTPQSGLEGVGAGLGSALGMYQSAVKGLQDQRQVFQEREQNQELKDLVPQLANRARQLGVSEDVIFSAELQANANVRSAITLLNNAISSAKTKTDTDTPAKPFQVTSEMRRMLTLPETVMYGRDEDGIPKYFDKFGEPVTGFPEAQEVTPQDGTVTAIDQPGFEDQAYIFLNGKNQLIKKTDIKEVKEKAGYKYTEPENMPEGAFLLEEDTQGKRRFVDQNYNTIQTQKEETFQETTVPLEPDEMNALGDPRVRFKTIKADGTVSYLDQYYTPVTGPPEVEEMQPETPLFMTGADLREREPALAKTLKLDDGDIFQIAYNDEGKPTNAFKPEWTKEKPAKEQPVYMTKAQALEGNATEKAFAGRMGDQDFLLKTGGKYTVEVMTPKEKEVDPDVFKNESTLRKEFNQVAKNYTGAVQAYMAVLQGAQLQNSTGDLMLIQAFQKMLDPTSVVRETEFANAQNTQGVLQKLGITLEKLKAGDMLGAKARARFVDASRAYMSQVQKAFAPQRDYYLNTAKRAGISTEAIRDPFDGVQGIDPNLATINFQEIYDAVDEETISGNVKDSSPIKENNPQASATKKVVESVKSAFTSESPPENIEDDEELNALLPGG